MPCPGSGLEDHGFCSFRWAQRSYLLALPGPNHGKTPSFLWALSGQALELGGQEGEVIFHFWYQCFWLSSGLALARAP